MNPRRYQFTEFREKDYRLPRSMREAYGFTPVLYEHKPESIIYRAISFIINYFGGR